MPDKLILITNDDGIESPGLRAAAETVAGLGKIIIAAPSTQQTAMSRALCGAKNEYFRLIDFPVEQNNITAYHIDASPAMTVQHAYNVLFNERKPDLIISGINYGENLGWDSMLSGTLGAAFQGASQGTPSIAVSLWYPARKFRSQHVGSPSILRGQESRSVPVAKRGRSRKTRRRVRSSPEYNDRDRQAVKRREPSSRVDPNFRQ